jgi:hypothetical protein
MNSCSVGEKVSPDSADRSLAVLRAIASWGHSYMGPRIRILPTPHHCASFGGRHDLHRLEPCFGPIYVRDGQPRRIRADLDDTRDTAASGFPYATHRGVGPPTRCH